MSLLQPGPGQHSGACLLGEHDIDVSPGQRWLRLAIHDQDVAEFGLVALDPSGRVRAQYWGKTTPEQVVIAPDPLRSSCGTVAGPLPIGRWRVQVFGALRTAASAYSLHLDSGDGQVPAGTLPAVGAQRWDDADAGTGLRLAQRHLARSWRAASAWYRGDFHAHTRASDGRQSPEALSRQASERGLDFFAITEHNLLTTGWPGNGVLVVPGIELTSTAGHFNAIGLHRWLDWRPNADDGGCESSEGIERLLTETRKQGAVASVNHPLLSPWRWRWADTPLDAFDAMEIWNDPTYPDNAEVLEPTLALWSRLWDDGHRIVGIGGSDTHLLPHDSYVPGGPPSVVGDPWTAVLADELSAVAIVDAVRAGRAYVSRGPVLNVWAQVGKDRFPPGASLTAALARQPQRRGSVRLQVDTADAGLGAVIHWVGTGAQEAVAVEPEGGTGTAAVERVWDAGAWQWLRVELRGADGTLLAVTNPFSAGEASPRLRTWGDLLAGSAQP